MCKIEIRLSRFGGRRRSTCSRLLRSFLESERLSRSFPLMVSPPLPQPPLYIPAYTLWLHSLSNAQSMYECTGSVYKSQGKFSQ